MHYVFLHEYHEKYPKIHCRVMISSKYSHALYCTVTESLIFFLHLLPFRLFPSCNIYDSYFFIVSFIHLNFSSFLMTKRIYFFFLIHNKKNDLQPETCTDHSVLKTYQRWLLFLSKHNKGCLQSTLYKTGSEGKLGKTVAMSTFYCV